MAVFSPTNAKVHFKAYDGSFSDYLSNTAITQNNGVAMSSVQTLFGQQSMYMADFNDSITFSDATVFDVGTGDYTVGFWFYPTQFTSWDRLFATDTYINNKPLRIYCHNGTIQVYAESTTDGNNTHDYLMGHYLGANAENKWHHIMVSREAGTTTLYISGVNQADSTMSYDIDNSSSPTLGADSTGGSGVKGYVQDFFWMDEALDTMNVFISQFDADQSPEPITFHVGNPSISSFSTSAASVANSGDSVTLSWSPLGETQLELLKYVGGLLTSTEDVLGLSSKSVTITETVSYKLRATNANGTVDSASVEIQLSQGGNNMSKISVGAAGLVLQKGMVTSSAELGASLMVDGVGGAGDLALNVALASLSSSVVAADAAVAAEAATARAAEAANAAAISAEETRALAAEAVIQADVDQNESDADAGIAAVAADLVSEAATARAAESANAAAISAEETRALAAEAAIQADVDGNESDADALFDKHESALGLQVDGSFAGFGASNYMGAANDMHEGIEKLDIQVAANEAGLTAEIATARAAELVLTNDLAAEAATARAAELVLTNDLASEAATARAAEGANAAAISAEETRALAAEGLLDARQSIMEGMLAFTGNGSGGGALVLTDQGVAGDVVTLTFAVDNGVKMLTIS